MRRACIDIGSNTTRLLVADCGDGDVSPCYEARAFTKLGACLDRDGAIPPAKLEEVAAVVAEQLSAAHAAGAEAITCVATAGVRRASNAADLLALIAARTSGLGVRVLSEAEEARYIFIGAQSKFADAPPEGTHAVVDVGGGSTELVVGRHPDQIEWWTSVPLGSSDRTTLGLHTDPPGPDELQVARTRARSAFSGLKPPRPSAVVAVGGSAGALLTVAGRRLDPESLAGALDRVTAAPAAATGKQAGLDSDRVRLLPAGLLILEAIVDLFGLPLMICSAGLREGVLLAAQ